MKKSLLIIALVLIAGGVLFKLKVFEPAPDLPNILLITLDTTRMDHMSCYGYERKTTPNLDLLAEKGQRFENTFAVSSWTLPTHASLFTGLYPTTHGAHYSDQGEVSLSSAVKIGRQDIYGWYKVDGLPERAKTLAETLQAAGFTTGGIGAGPWMKATFGLSQGFDYYDCDVVSVAGRKGDEVTALGMNFLRRNKDKPFFLFLNYFDPHDPYKPPNELRFKFFPKEKIGLVQKDPKLYLDYEISQYDAEILFMDMQIGRIFRRLNTLGLFKNTWIIVTADHGEMFGDHGLYQHGYSLYDPEVRCPLIIKWPEGWEKLPSVTARCQQVDIMPTILDRLGLQPLAPFEGRPMGSPERPAVCSLYRNEGNLKTGGPRFDRSLTALYSGQYKLILSSRTGDPDAGLFDLSADPGELNNLRATLPDKAKELESLLEQWKGSLLPPLPPKRIESIDEMTQEQLEALGYGH